MDTPRSDMSDSVSIVTITDTVSPQRTGSATSILTQRPRLHCPPPRAALPHAAKTIIQMASIHSRFIFASVAFIGCFS